MGFCVFYSKFGLFNIMFVMVNILTLIILNRAQHSLQRCAEEISNTGIQMVWHETSEATNVESDPVCFHNDSLITRNCTDEKWQPPLDKVQSCMKAVKYFDILSCPPGFNKLSENINKFCYQIGKPSAWDHPCFESGGATVITELNKNETLSLLNSLNLTGNKYFWLPARRLKVFSPIIWYVPGPNWGQEVKSLQVPMQPSLTKNCLLLDIEKQILLTDSCSKEHHSLCIYINDLQKPAQCPEGYRAFRYMLDVDVNKCFGIQFSDRELTYQEFKEVKCKSPMGIGKYTELRRFAFSKIATTNKISSDMWCWFGLVNEINHSNNTINVNESSSFTGVINNEGTVSLFDASETLSCMACEAEMISSETELQFEYRESEKKMYLTVYYPCGLWKYNDDDRGIQCFSDAMGFVMVIDVNDLALAVDMETSLTSETFDVDKHVFVIDLVTETSARYWCEGHTKNFSIISTKKIIVNPLGNEVHVFSLTVQINMHLNEYDNLLTAMSNLTEHLTDMFKAQKVLLMDILDYQEDSFTIVMHVHVDIEDIYKDIALNLLKTYDCLNNIIDNEFPKYNYTLINLSSSIYCLPTTSEESYVIANWCLTPIGMITTPKQFCLQANGLPVNRYCQGSYLLGSVWGPIEGQCDLNFVPSNTTRYLFSYMEGSFEFVSISHFLTTGLGYVLDDIDIIIPADIYFISVLFQTIISITNQNEEYVETGDLENIAWVMDRIMAIDNINLHLAQTLNSSNVILDSVNNIIELITQQNKSSNISKLIKEACKYSLAVQPRFIVQISYPKFNNITGIAVIKTNSSDEFDDMTIQTLYANTTLEEIISIKNLEVATWFPSINLKTLENNSSRKRDDMHIVISVYKNDVIFQQVTNKKFMTNSRIIEVTVPGYATNLEYPIPLVFRDLNLTTLPKTCGYWDLQSDDGKIPGSWSKRGCFLVKIINDLTICQCYHLTHFGQIFNIKGSHGRESHIIDEHHKKALNIITLVGSFLSLLGVIGIWVTAIVFNTWRKKIGTKVLLQLSTAIALPLLLLITFNLDDSIIVETEGQYKVASHMHIACITLGALFHYSVLANFVWMLITAVLQFIRYVRVLGVSRPSRFMFKLSVTGWGLPCIPVIIVLLVDRENYIPTPISGNSICYPSGIYMIFGVVVPICIILFINVILFLLVLKAISTKSDLRATDKSLVYAQFRLSILLFFLLGLTWIFGIVSFYGRLIWSYLFCLTSTVQGFVLFIYFVICDPTTRILWTRLVKPQFTASRSSISSISSG